MSGIIAVCDTDMAQTDKTYDKSIHDNEIIWTLKKDIRLGIRKIIDNHLESFINEHGYEEIDDIDKCVG